MKKAEKLAEPLFAAVVLFSLFAAIGCSSSTGPSDGNAMSYTVTYDSNGKTDGDVPTDLSTYAQGQKVTALPAGTLAKTGFQFAGWMTRMDGSGSSYSAGCQFAMGSSSVTLYAIWVPSSYAMSNSGTTIHITSCGTPLPTGSLVIPEGVTSLGYNAFIDCVDVTSLSLPQSMTYIGQQAFWGCTSLTTVNIPAKVSSFGSGPFGGCTALTSFTVDPANTNFKSLNGFLVSTNGMLIQAPRGSGASVTIPNGVTSICSEAFGNYENLTSVSIPATVTSIDTYAFLGCSGLTGITIPNSVTSIMDMAFYRCGLVSLDIPASVNYIGDCVFGECYHLTTVTVDSGNATFKATSNFLINKTTHTLVEYPCVLGGSVVIPSDVAAIGQKAFDSCSSITSITIPSSVTSIGDLAFQGDSGLTDLYVQNPTPPTCEGMGNRFLWNCRNVNIHVPSGSLSAYQNANGWNTYADNTTYSIKIVSP